MVVGGDVLESMAEQLVEVVGADVVRVVVGLGTVVVLPLGLRLLGDRAVPRSRSLVWPTVGVLAAVSVWLPVGAFAALLDPDGAGSA